MVYAVIPVFSLGGMAGPAAQALISRQVSPSEQGQLQGANASLMGIANLIGPAVFSQAFAHAIGEHAIIHLPGAPFLLASLLLAIAMVVALRATSRGAPQP